MKKLPTSVLFVCSENSLRSPMCEGLAKARFSNRIYLDSVGVRAGVLDAMAVAVMAEIGIDISDHVPKLLEPTAEGSFDLIIALTPEAQHWAVEMTRTWSSEVEYWRTFDPSVVEGTRDARLNAYRQVRDDLQRQINERFGV